MITVLVLQAAISNNFWVHEQTSAQFASHSMFSHQQAVLRAQKPGLATKSLACQDFMGRSSRRISWDEPGTQRGCKPAGCLASLILQLAQQFVGWEGDADWRAGIKYFVFGEPLEMACKANPPLCGASWEMTVPIFIAAYHWGSVLLTRARRCPIRPPSRRVIAAVSPLLLALQKQINKKRVCCIWHVNWVSAPQICFFSSPFYLVFNTKQPPLITSRLKPLSD